MWRSSGLRLGARLCCPRGGARAPAERGHRSLVSCIDRKAPPGEQVSGARAGAVVSAPAERAVAPGGRRRGPPRTAPPAACHPWRSPRPIHLGGPRADLALSDLRQPVAPLGLACYLSRTPPTPPPPPPRADMVAEPALNRVVQASRFLSPVLSAALRTAWSSDFPPECLKHAGPGLLSHGL